MALPVWPSTAPGAADPGTGAPLPAAGGAGAVSKPNATFDFYQGQEAVNGADLAVLPPTWDTALITSVPVFAKPKTTSRVEAYEQTGEILMQPYEIHADVSYVDFAVAGNRCLWAENGLWLRICSAPIRSMTGTTTGTFYVIADVYQYQPE